MFSTRHCKQLAVLLTLALIQMGCSISASVESSSDSVSASLESITSISTSSSGSSGDEEQKVEETGNLYVEDIAALTVLYVSREKTKEEFQRQITITAQTHGLNDWEQEDSTYTAMGKGLKRAGINEDAITTIAYFGALPSSKYKLVLKGYDN